MVDNYTFNDLGIGELRPGVSPRRWEPEGGVSKLNERIHKESKFADNYKNLPFSFKKPPKPKGRPKLMMCNNCGSLFYGTTITVGVICKHCKEFSTVSEVNNTKDD